MDKNIIKKPLVQNMHYFIKWTIISVITGIIVGFIGACFGYGVTWATSLWTNNDFMIYFLPVSGLIIVWLYKTFHEEKNRGTNMVIDSISSEEDISIRTAPLIFISTILTHMAGGSSGREGAALQLGGSIGSLISKVIKLDSKDKKIAVMCGMSACFAAIFGTPIAAAVFSMEVISIGVMYYAALIPCLFSAYTGLFIAKLMGLSGEHYNIGAIPEFSLLTCLYIILLGMLCAIVSTLFCVTMHKSEHLYKKYIPNAYIRILVASAIFIALTLLSGTRDYNGGGFPLIERCMNGEVRYEAFLMKIIFTAVALSAGFKGGEIVPTLCIGATLGCAFGNIIGFSPALCTACGMAALFVGVTNCPVTSILIAFELFGFEAAPYYSIIIAVCFTLSGYYGLYSSQKFIYSKTKTEYINRKTN